MGPSLSAMVRKLHSLTTQELNHRENKPGRSRLWQNFRETHLTHQRSYLARLNYVHQNAVHHKLVSIGSDWNWCSASGFRKAVSPAWLKTISSFKYDLTSRGGDHVAVEAHSRGLRQPAAAFVLAACCGILGLGLVME